jgi:hypothetical protein
MTADDLFRDETDDPLVADWRYFFKVELWTRTGRHIERLLSPATASTRRALFAVYGRRRPRARLNIRQRSPVLEEWPNPQPRFQNSTSAATIRFQIYCFRGRRSMQGAVLLIAVAVLGLGFATWLAVTILQGFFDGTRKFINYTTKAFGDQRQRRSQEQIENFRHHNPVQIIGLPDFDLRNRTSISLDKFVASVKSYRPQFWQPACIANHSLGI